MENLLEINTKTCFLKGIDNSTCKIVNGIEEKTVKMSLKKFLNYNCEYYGSSFEGRKQSSKRLLGMKYKLPIVIEESREMVFFPTTSSESNNCIWISLNNISSYEEKDFSTVVTFNTGQIEKFDISMESFENQVLRASKLLLILKNRKQSK